MNWAPCRILQAAMTSCKILCRISFLLEHINTLWVLSFGMIQIRISDPRSLGSWCIKGTSESTLEDSAVPLMHHDPSDLGSLILIIPKECTP